MTSTKSNDGNQRQNELEESQEQIWKLEFGNPLNLPQYLIINYYIILCQKK